MKRAASQIGRKAWPENRAASASRSRLIAEGFELLPQPRCQAGAVVVFEHDRFAAHVEDDDEEPGDQAADDGERDDARARVGVQRETRRDDGAEYSGDAEDDQGAEGKE